MAGIKVLRHRVMKGCKVAAKQLTEKYDIKLDLDSEFIESSMSIVVGSAFWGISMIPVDKLKEFPLFEGVNSSAFSVLDNSQSLIKGLGEELLSEGVAVGSNGIVNYSCLKAGACSLLTEGEPNIRTID